MTIQEVWQWYLKLLVDQAQYDLGVFSHWWMWAPLMIPALFYFFFVVIKWSVLTLPVTFAIGVMLRFWYTLVRR